MLPYFPLASGVLTGKYQRGDEVPPAAGSRMGHGGTLTDERFDVVEALQAYAAERGIALLDVAIGALAAQPAVDSVIAGATTAGAGRGERRRRAMAADRGGSRGAGQDRPEFAAELAVVRDPLPVGIARTLGGRSYDSDGPFRH